MLFGLQIKEWSKKNKDKILTEAGYRKFPNHSFARLQPEEQWVNNCSTLRINFPRFHLIYDKHKWYIHCDMSREDHSKITTNNVHYEIKRLKNIEKKFQYAKSNNLEINAKI